MNSRFAYKMRKVFKMSLLLQFLIWNMLTPVHLIRYYKDGKVKELLHDTKQSPTSASVQLYPTHAVPVNSPFRNTYRKNPRRNIMIAYPTNGSGLFTIFSKPSILEEYTESFHNNNSTSTDNTALKVNQYHHHQQMMSTCQTMCACKWKGGKQTVECIDRLLVKIPANIDGSTQVLDMSGNKFHTLHNEQFIRANLLNLQKLYLRSCQIVFIEVQTFKGLTNLVELDLSHNSLTSVPSKALAFISSLRDLTLSSNRINKIESNAFAGIPSLHKLDLSHCGLREIAAKAFEGLEGLTLLRLNGNKLSELVTKTIKTLSRLHGIELHDNPWMCDCRLRDAKLWLMEKNIPYPVAPACNGGPQRFINQTFNDLNVNDFACKPEMLPINHYVEANTGENASILCKAKAIPDPSISWYWNGRLLSNNTVFSSHQRLIILESGGFTKTSRLLLTNAQEIDSSEFYCVAENRAGSAESNFTLHVRMRAAGMESLASRHIVGLSATLTGLIVFVVAAIMFLAMRLKRETYPPSKSTNHLEVITNMNHQNRIVNKSQPLVLNGSTSGPLSNFIDSKNSLNDPVDTQLDKKESSSTQNTNPLQKPPRLTDISYVNNSYDKSSSLMATSSCLISPATSIGNNPDLINDMKRFENDEFSDLKITTDLPQALFRDFTTATADGNYKDVGGCSSLFPPSLWEDLLTLPATCTSSADDLFLRHYSDKTPFLGTHQLYDSPGNATNAENCCKTFPRGSYGHDGTIDCNVFGVEGSDSTESTTTTTNLSNSGSGIVLMSGYPNDYGLPLVPGAELQYNQHLQMHPLRNLGKRDCTEREIGSLNNKDYYNNKRMNLNNTASDILPPFTSRTLPRKKSGAVGSLFSTTVPPTLDNLNNSPLQNLHNLTTGSFGDNNICAAGDEASTQTLNGKTIRVWQKGGVPVLPPLTAIKRALISSNRNSPDEGYQEGCGTDV